METKKDYTINENVKVLDGLTEVLQEQVSMMKRLPLNEIAIWTDTQLDNDEKGSKAENPIDDPYQRFFYHKNDDFFTYEITNMPLLTVEFKFSDEEETRFLRLPNHTLFENDDKGHYFADCGEDYKKAAYLFSEVARLVYNFKGERKFFCFDIGKKFGSSKYCNLMMNFKLPNKPEVKDAINEKIRAYNQKASHYKDATPLTFDEDTFIVSGKNTSHISGWLIKSDALRKKFISVCRLCSDLSKEL